ncbi:MAG TPA: glycosyltransferase, partial [Bryobacteraceae bacterium]|nr:glycosyltransferase [Bryobacteraceae bacterium]
GLAALGGDSEFIAYLSVEDTEARVRGGCRVRRVSANPFLRLGWDLAMQLRRDRPELVHVQYTAPLACPVPVVVSVHDVSFLEHPEYFQYLRREQLRLTVSRTVRAAARVITGSEFSRASIARAYDLDPDAIAVVPNAASSMFRPVERSVAATQVSRRFGIPEPFLLTVGDLQPRKNQIGLIRAFASLAREFPQLRHNLVIAGKDTWFSPHVRRAAGECGVADRVRFTGFVSDQDLLLLYGACDTFIFPSFYEGFGLPVLEAMACGRAVACSRTSALPEVADAAAIFFDPGSEDEIARAMSDLLLDTGLRTRMEKLGMSRAARFSWRDTAEKTLQVYHQVAGHQHAHLGSAVPVARS